jgi:hypothetical protein
MWRELTSRHTADPEVPHYLPALAAHHRSGLDGLQQIEAACTAPGLSKISGWKSYPRLLSEVVLRSHDLLEILDSAVLPMRYQFGLDKRGCTVFEEAAQSRNSCAACVTALVGFPGDLKRSSLRWSGSSSADVAPHWRCKNARH